ncbi:unnamed protein product [Effrenium voratum]|uniref:Uncharacterized protein n=1 Tax=Effrenium voratum TaxID=2562239 RepID=A0AA36J5U4_9DINO|nr:unnamed protein product [Effrenium voratum]
MRCRRDGVLTRTIKVAPITPIPRPVRPVGTLLPPLRPRSQTAGRPTRTLPPGRPSMPIAPPASQALASRVQAGSRRQHQLRRLPPRRRSLAAGPWTSRILSGQKARSTYSRARSNCSTNPCIAP